MRAGGKVVSSRGAAANSLLTSFESLKFNIQYGTSNVSVAQLFVVEP